MIEAVALTVNDKNTVDIVRALVNDIDALAAFGEAGRVYQPVAGTGLDQPITSLASVLCKPVIHGADWFDDVVHFISPCHLGLK